MKILNLGCGNKTSKNPEFINIDWSIYLKIKNNPFLKLTASIFLNEERLEKLKSLPKNIKIHDLANGIPFEDNTVDAVYHSHFLEHLERQAAKEFLMEIRRVLKPGGICRIVVPDFELNCKSYILHIADCESNQAEIDKQDDYIAGIIEQSVRQEAHGTSRQKPLRRFIENILLGDARKRGEIHQWMYDRFSLKAMLLQLGYLEIHIKKYNESLIPNWNSYGLDLDENGNEYKPGSLYVEGVK
jgi:ubiquinone/menaquinone biosynthesis C-methylase UbiE